MDDRERPTPRPLRVLLVEDSDDDIVAATRTIAACGVACEIDVARDGREAMEMLQRDATAGHAVPDLMLLDVGLPGADGLELLRSVRESEPLSGLTVILLTGSESEEHMRTGQLLGAHTQLAKPIATATFTWIAKAVQRCAERLETRAA